MACPKLPPDYFSFLEHPKTPYRAFFVWNHGQMSELHTYRRDDACIVSTTIWANDSATGLLTSKKDANNKCLPKGIEIYQ